MSDQKKDGGPDLGPGRIEFLPYQLSMRQLYKIAALQGLTANPCWATRCSEITRQAAEWADEAVAEDEAREKNL